MAPKLSQNRAKMEPTSQKRPSGGQNQHRRVSEGVSAKVAHPILLKKGSKEEPPARALEAFGGAKKAILEKRQCAHNVFCRFLISFLRIVIFHRVLVQKVTKKRRKSTCFFVMFLCRAPSQKHVFLHANPHGATTFQGLRKTFEKLKKRRKTR